MTPGGRRSWRATGFRPWRHARPARARQGDDAAGASPHLEGTPGLCLAGMVAARSVPSDRGNAAGRVLHGFAHPSARGVQPVASDEARLTRLLFAPRIPADATPSCCTRHDPAIAVATVPHAVTAFERTLIPPAAPFDAFVAGDGNTLPPAARRGFNLFAGRAGRVSCHTSRAFTDGSLHDPDWTTRSRPRRPDAPRHRSARLHRS